MFLGLTFYQTRFSLPCQTYVQGYSWYKKIDASQYLNAYPHCRAISCPWQITLLKTFSSKPHKTERVGIQKNVVPEQKGNIFHLSITGCFRFSSVPIQASSIRTSPPFRVCIQDAICLPAVDKFKGYADRNPAFASFYITSVFWLKVRISFHFGPPNFLWETDHLF